MARRTRSPRPGNAPPGEVAGARSGARPRPADRNALVAALNWESRRSSVFFGLLNRAIASRLGLNPSDTEALGILAVIGNSTPTALARLLGVGTGAATLILDRLERAGYLQRVRATDDRRSITAELIPERAQEAAELYRPLQQAAMGILSDYDDRELAIIVDYLSRANDMLRDVTSQIAHDDQRPRSPR